MRPFSWERFETVPVTGIMRNIPEQYIENIVTAYSQAGMTTLEVTMNSAKAVSVIERLVDGFGDKLNIGAGTVCTKADLDKAVAAGAQFIVTPVYDKSVMKACRKRELPVFCGAYTPTEIYKAWKKGATMVKVFPATALGAGYIKEVLAPLNDIKLLPTGGITAANFTHFLSAGAKGVGMGSNLFPKHIWEDHESLKELYTGIVHQYIAYKTGASPLT